MSFKSLAFIGMTGAALLSACSTTGAADGPARPGPDAPSGAQVAVFETIFAANASAIQDRAAAFCIGTGSGTELKDAASAVLTAFAGNPKVKPASACMVAPGGNGVFDRQSRQHALLFGVETISCASATDCTIGGGYYEGNLSSQRNIYRATARDGRWTAVMQEMGPVS